MGALTEYSAYLETVPQDDLELSLRIEEGARLESVEELRRSGFTFTEISELVIPPRTLKHRKAKHQRLTREETERMLRVVRVKAFADRVFGDSEKAMRWLRIPDDRLRDKAPLSLLKTEAGGSVVQTLLWQMDANMYA